MKNKYNVNALNKRKNKKYVITMSKIQQQCTNDKFVPHVLVSSEIY